MILYEKNGWRIIAKKQGGKFAIYKQVKKIFGDSFYSDFLTFVNPENIDKLKSDLKKAGG